MMTEEEKARRERFINGRNVQNKKALLSDDEVNRREAFISSQNLCVNFNCDNHKIIVDIFADLSVLNSPL